MRIVQCLAALSLFSDVWRVVLFGMSFAGDVNCLAQVTVVRVLHMWSFISDCKISRTVIMEFSNGTWILLRFTSSSDLKYQALYCQWFSESIQFLFTKSQFDKISHLISIRLGEIQLQDQFCLDINEILREVMLWIVQARNNPQIVIMQQIHVYINNWFVYPWWKGIYLKGLLLIDITQTKIHFNWIINYFLPSPTKYLLNTHISLSVHKRKTNQTSFDFFFTFLFASKKKPHHASQGWLIGYNCFYIRLDLALDGKLRKVSGWDTPVS